MDTLKISDTSIQQNQLSLAEIIIAGYCRGNYNKMIPCDIHKLCMWMFVEELDEFDKFVSNKYFTVKSKYNIVEFITIIRRPRNYTKRYHQWINAYGSLKVQKGDIKRWKFKLTDNEYPNIHIGIIDADQKNNIDLQNHKGEFAYLSNDCYSFYTLNGKIWKLWSLPTIDYAKRCKNNDMIEMTLDMTGNKYGKLSFKINDKDYGVGVDNIDINKGYYMAISMYDTGQVQLL